MTTTSAVVVEEQPLNDNDESLHRNTDDNITQGLLSHKKKRFMQQQPSQQQDWLRPYWLGIGLFMILFSFWLLDSLKDPLFAALVDGNLDRHQPPAKLCSVGSTLLLVCVLEFLSHNARTKKQQEERRTNDRDVLDPGGRWTRMAMDDRQGRGGGAMEDGVSITIFAYVGGSYMCVFSLLATVLRNHHPSKHNSIVSSSTPAWHVLGYILYATIESFGSLSVAAFWSYTNSTLSLEDAETFYGIIIAIAQLGAIAGSTMVTTHYWSTFTLILVANLIIVLQILVMMSYARHFRPTAAATDVQPTHPPETTTVATSSEGHQPVFWSGIYLILRHNYVMLILGVSCLYEVSLTCLDYQMKLLGWYKFEKTVSTTTISFTQFMGHYGQLTNITSLFFSYFAFPMLIRKFGLRRTLRLFPTLLLVATVVAYGALPGNLAVLFISMAVLKAMTYSIHDPSKELLYLPTSNAIKFRAKFWIDVVGARVAKAIGSTINTYAGSVDQSVRVGTMPSLLTAAALWFVCYRVGFQFDRLVQDGSIVGHDDASSRDTKGGYSKVATQEDNADLEAEQTGLSADDHDTNNVELTPLRPKSPV